MPRFPSRHLGALIAAAILTISPRAAAESPEFPATCLKQPTQSCIIEAAKAIARAAAESRDPYAQVLMPRVQQQIVNAQIESGNLEAALAAAEAMRKASDTNGYEEAIESIAHAEARKGRIERALQLVGSAKDDRRVSLLTVIADGQIAVGNIAEARRTLVAANDAVERVADGTSRVMEMVAISMVMTRLGDKGGAEAKLDAARVIADHLDKEVFRAVSLSIVSGEYASLGAWDKALAIARSIQSNDFRSGALVYFVKAATRQKNAIDISAMIAEALTAARSDSFPVSRVGSLMEIANLQSLLGDGRAAADTTNEALQIAQGIKNRLEHSSAMQAVARGQAGAGQVRHALELALTIDPEIERAEALLEIAMAMARRSSTT
jgi:tetratricopeptide (TPR) repeat protein